MYMICGVGFLLFIAIRAESFRFSRQIYVGDYIDENDDSFIKLHYPIEVFAETNNTSINPEMFLDNGINLSEKLMNGTTKINLEKLPQQVFIEDSYAYFNIVIREAQQIIKKADLVINLHGSEPHYNYTQLFSKPLYILNYVINLSQYFLETEDPIETVIEAEFNLTLKLSGDYSSFFKLKPNAKTIDITMIKVLPLEKIKLPVLHLILHANYKDKMENIIIAINLPQNNCLKFSKILYDVDYIINEDKTINITSKDAIELSEFCQINNVEVIGDHSDKFYWEVIENKLQLNSVIELPSNVYKKRILLYTIQVALKNNSATPETVIALHLPSITALQEPHFSKPLYNILCVYNLKLQNYSFNFIEQISIATDHFVEYELSGQYAELFQIKDLKGDVRLWINQTPPLELFEEKEVILTLTATIADYNVPIQTVLLIKFGEENKETNKEVLQIDESLNQSDGPLRFEQPSYSFIFGASVTGPLGRIKAIGNTSEILYSLQSEDGDLGDALVIDKDTGDLTLESPLTNGFYFVKVTAITAKNRKRAICQVQITVDSVEYDNGTIKAAYSLLVKHIKENSTDADILVNEHKDYVYTIVDQYPPTDPPLFTVSSFTQSLTTTKKLDRESKELQDLCVPQYILTLKLSKAGEQPAVNTKTHNNTLIQRGRCKTTPGREWVNVENKIFNRFDETVVAIIVDDLNDNRPVIVGGKKTVVGYPIPDIAEEIGCSYVTKITAIDRDEGYNSYIKFSLDTDCFLIHPETGVIYPTQKAFDSNNWNFVVTARDQNGKGLSSSMQIEVRPLDETHLAVISIKNLFLENVDYALQNLSAISQLNLKPLSKFSTLVDQPNETPPTTHFLDIITYAFDSKGDVVKATQIRNSIESLNIDNAVIVNLWTVWRKYKNNSNGQTIQYTKSEEENVGLTIAVVVLGIALFITVVCWSICYLKSRNCSRNNISLNNTSMDNLKNFDKNAGKVSSLRRTSTDSRPDAFVFNSPRLDNNRSSSRF